MSELLGPTKMKMKRMGMGASKAEQSSADSLRRINTNVGLSRKSKVPDSNTESNVAQMERQPYIGIN